MKHFRFFQEVVFLANFYFMHLFGCICKTSFSKRLRELGFLIYNCFLEVYESRLIFFLSWTYKWCRRTPLFLQIYQQVKRKWKSLALTRLNAVIGRFRKVAVRWARWRLVDFTWIALNWSSPSWWSIPTANRFVSRLISLNIETTQMSWSTQSICRPLRSEFGGSSIGKCYFWLFVYSVILKFGRTPFPVFDLSKSCFQLSAFRRRLKSEFTDFLIFRSFSRHLAFIHDVQYLAINASKYNRRGAEIITNACVLVKTIFDCIRFVWRYFWCFFNWTSCFSDFTISDASKLYDDIKSEGPLDLNGVLGGGLLRVKTDRSTMFIEINGWEEFQIFCKAIFIIVKFFHVFATLDL